MTSITHTSYGSFCDCCGASLGQEEIDFECCDCCGGEGLGGDDDIDWPIDWPEDDDREGSAHG